MKAVSIANSAKSCDENCGPLSLITVSGTPNREKMDFSTSVTIGVVVLAFLDLRVP